MKLKLTGVEEGREFQFKDSKVISKLENGKLYVKGDNNWFNNSYSINYVLNNEIELLPEKIKITEKEKKILEGRLLEGYEWVVKHENGVVSFFTSRPNKNTFYWGSDSPYTGTLCNFKFLSWEDEEPTNIKELLENVEVEE